MNDKTCTRVWKWSLVGLFGVAALAMAAGGCWLYPFVQSWPTPSRSTETLLIRRDGDHVLFLNKLRHRPDPAMTLRIPLSRSEIPAVQAALGKTGAFEGRDNRGVKVLAEILPVPGSPWFMVAKVDADEIFAEARYHGQFILLFTALSVLVTVAMAAFVFSYRQKTLYHNLFRAEQERRQVEEEILATFYSIGDGVISTDAAGRVTRMNPVAEHLTGWREAEALGKPSKQVFHIVDEETQAEVANPIQRVLREGTVVNLANHTLLVARDGTEHPIADSGAPIRNEQGQITGVVLVFRDQTEERRAEMALQESEERYRVLFEDSTQGILVTDVETRRLIYANPSICQMLGYTEDALTRLRVTDIHPEDSLDHVASEFDAHVRGEKTLTSALPCVRKDGTVFYADVNGSVIGIEGRRCIVGFFTDITERKLAEEKLKDARALLDSALGAITDIFYVFDASGRILIWNEALTRVTGYSDEELSSKQVTDFFSGQDVQRISESVERVWKDGKAQPEANLVTKDGTHLPYEFTGSILRDGKGNTIGLSGIGRDLTERKRTEKALRTNEAMVSCILNSLGHARTRKLIAQTTER